MLKVAQLLRFLSEMNPQATPTRLAIYNYLKNFHAAEEPLEPETLNRFFVFCLEDPHWLRSKNLLSHEVHHLLKNFNSFYQSQLDLKKIQFPESLQIIEIENTEDFLSACEHYASRVTLETQKFKIINDQDKRALWITLNSDRSLEVRALDRKFTLRQGYLEPLDLHQCVYFTPQLELSQSHMHILEIAPHMMSQFEVRNGGVYGIVSRGYVFQKFQTFQGEKLASLSRLFWPLKRLEQFFLVRTSDTFYMELMKKLEQLKRSWPVKDAAAAQSFNLLLNQAEMASELIYIGDIPLLNLVNDLKKISSREAGEKCLKITPKKEFDLTN